jgi:hypothetical protein
MPERAITMDWNWRSQSTGMRDHNGPDYAIIQIDRVVEIEERQEEPRHLGSVGMNSCDSTPKSAVSRPMPVFAGCSRLLRQRAMGAVATEGAAMRKLMVALAAGMAVTGWSVASAESPEDALTVTLHVTNHATISRAGCCPSWEFSRAKRTRCLCTMLSHSVPRFMMTRVRRASGKLIWTSVNRKCSRPDRRPLVSHWRV